MVISEGIVISIRGFDRSIVGPMDNEGEREGISVGNGVVGFFVGLMVLVGELLGEAEDGVGAKLVEG